MLQFGLVGQLQLNKKTVQYSGDWYTHLLIVEDLDKLREMETSGEMRGPNNSNVVEGVMARLTEVEGLSEAFNGCRGVFQTAAFIDPAGLSGYSVSLLWHFLLLQSS